MIRPLALALLLAASAAAAAPDRSLRPEARPGASLAGTVVTTRRAGPPGTPARTTVETAQAETDSPRFSLRPLLRSLGVENTARKQRALRAKGAVCGTPEIQGERLNTVAGRGACGVTDAVRVRSVSGVVLSQQSVMDCRTAQVLNAWVAQSAKPVLRRRGGGLARLEVAAHYACRGRNNQSGARLSEHGKGRAIDISGFTLRDGYTISVLRGWNSADFGPMLRTMHKQACGPFGTVLGPGSDRFHSDHFHFDTARYRSGSYCR
ncbi:extensin family protein [Sulfitobacter sp. D35]|uniref:extensin-like domain-containing protein n=1 Tax=Sulfitobacter sp. D35 TaxID=3083252 RepID=UPI00296EEEDA|nr:extensin family protein [Sulfitobacter sp. D35]MDW4499807.1 extensin family protein [Sulfitobacter sp. D35]